MWPDRFHLRTCFGISDPAAAKDLSLELGYLGGAVVYLNGKEVGRGHLPAGSLDAAAFAEDYPAEVYVTEDGTTPLPSLRKQNMTPEPQWTDRYERRIRHLTLRLPAESLVKGSNVLAVEIRRAAVSRLGRMSWDHAGFHSARLVSAGGTGTVAWTAAVAQTYVWNAWPMETVTEQRMPRWPGLNWWAAPPRSKPTRGLETGNPFDPLRPVRIAVPRNGNCAGVAVVSDPRRQGCFGESQSTGRAGRGDAPARGH